MASFLYELGDSVRRLTLTLIGAVLMVLLLLDVLCLNKTCTESEHTEAIPMLLGIVIVVMGVERIVQVALRDWPRG